MNWINLKEQKPEHGQKVLISNGQIVTAATADTGTFLYTSWDGCEFGGWGWEWYFDEKSITHWMPLPEPPTEG